MEVSRRKFLGSSAAAVVVAGTMAKGKVFGANDRIAVATMGIHGQGGSHLKQFLGQEDAQVVALCDVDSRVLEGRVKQAAEAQGGAAPKGYVDIRDMVADDAIDAISIATPNHWHTLGAVWACQAGKHVYVEKPLSHSVWEGRQLVAAAQKYNRVVQHGTQSRSNPNIMRDMKLMHEGFIGDIVMSRGVVYKNGNRYAIGHGQPAAPPEYLEWNLWQGPAEESDYLAKEDGGGLFVHYNWHWFWRYGNGEIGNQGVHEMDLACWAINKGLPVKVYSSGGRYAWDDDAETPNTQSSTFTYADGTMLEFEVRNLGSFAEADAGSCTNSAFGTKGYWVRGKGFFTYKNEPIKVDEPEPESAGHIGNFLKAIRSGKPEDNQAPAEAGHIACAHIHLANTAYRLGQSLEFDPEKQRFVGEGHRKANKMLKRRYREPFSVPEIA
ncbi:MAG: Gfo/Idh/MocA family oxidoreductase [Candidatus Hydrogenedentes bacterium]|nr:Gfo/Idh/MocA family oxidoreductase [Candidatus Hydrogenedentota bacterium]